MSCDTVASTSSLWMSKITKNASSSIPTTFTIQPALFSDPVNTNSSNGEFIRVLITGSANIFISKSLKLVFGTTQVELEKDYVALNNISLLLKVKTLAATLTTGATASVIATARLLNLTTLDVSENDSFEAQSSLTKVEGGNKALKRSLSVNVACLIKKSDLAYAYCVGLQTDKYVYADVFVGDNNTKYKLNATVSNLNIGAPLRDFVKISFTLNSSGYFSKS